MLTPEQVELLWKKFDADSSATLARKEFAKLCHTNLGALAGLEKKVLSKGFLRNLYCAMIAAVRRSAGASGESEEALDEEALVGRENFTKLFPAEWRACLGQSVVVVVVEAVEGV